VLSVGENGTREMTKNKFIAVAVFLAVHSAVIAGNILRTGVISPYSQQGYGAFLIEVPSFIVLSLLVWTVKQKYWRTGGVLVALSGLSRSSITCFPDHKVAFGIITMVISLAAIAALLISLRLERFDLSWWEQKHKKNTYQTVLLLLTVIIVIGIFLYWGRG
jgi:hypothetical protein